MTAAGRATIPALLYHHVGEPRPGAWRLLTVSPRRFEAQVRALVAAGYTGITARHWVDHVEGRVELPERPILITFDDAYRDLEAHALPVLRRYGFSATVLVVTAHVGGRSAWDEAAGLSTHPLMDAEALRVWSERGIELGAHSRTHVDLRGLGSAALEEELEGSRRDLEALTGGPVRAFAYPYGHFDDAVRRRVAEVYRIAFTTRSGLNRAGAPLAETRRTAVVPQDGPLDVLVRARLGWNPQDLLRRGVDSGRRPT